MLVETLDQMCSTITRVQNEIADLEEEIDRKKASISSIKSQVEEYFRETHREDPYTSPFGTLYLRSELQVKQPKGEALHEFFLHLCKIYGPDLAWQKMSIHNQTLKAEIKDHIKAVEERGGDPILEPLPGIEPPTTYKMLVFKRGKNAKSQ